MDKLDARNAIRSTISVCLILTGPQANRRGLQNRLDTCWRWDGDNHYALLDIDHFKGLATITMVICDGDQALIRVSLPFATPVRSRDIVARRWRGVMVPLTNSSEETAWKMFRTYTSAGPGPGRSRICLMPKAPPPTSPHQHSLTPLINDNIEQRLARADGALWRGKNKGRNIILAVDLRALRHRADKSSRHAACKQPISVIIII